MGDDEPQRSGLEGLSPSARRAVAAAEAEARRGGLGSLGTEHLMLGVLTVEDARGGRALSGAGLTIDTARRKVDEAVNAGTRTATEARDGDLVWSARAERALGRAFRFAQESRASEVGTSHLLLGVLDVEGTAGQVLRGLSIDLDAVRGVLEAPPAMASPEGTTPSEQSARQARCPACGENVDGHLRHVTLTSRGGHGDREVIAFVCGHCATVLGVAPPPR